jgi:dephospho-CoA kinase
MSEPPVVVISGQVAAGKTMAGRMLEQQGFQYARISQAIRTRWEGPADPPRSWFQEMGMHLHRTVGQRVLCEETLAFIAMPSASFVIDGLRWREDMEFFKERFPARLVHLHLTAPTQVRKERFISREKDVSFEEADEHEVERGVAELAECAGAVFDNGSDGDLKLHRFLNTMLERYRHAG